MKQIIKHLIPPLLLTSLKKVRNNKYGWKGDYLTWQQAESDATGYDSDKIVQAVSSSLLKVKNNEAVYERDSVVFNEIQYSWPLLSGLLLASVKGGAVKVLDFGGSLGSTYYQNKKFLDKIDTVSWSIVEQKKFVDLGMNIFEDNRLKFFYSVDECVKSEKPNTLLLSSVLQYIEKPYELLDDILKNKFDYILIDRTPFNVEDKDKITLQIVPPDIYEASYPCWFFDKSYFINFFISKNYSIVESFSGFDRADVVCDFNGIIFKKD